MKTIYFIFTFSFNFTFFIKNQLLLFFQYFKNINKYVTYKLTIFIYKRNKKRKNMLNRIKFKKNSMFFLLLFNTTLGFCFTFNSSFKFNYKDYSNPKFKNSKILTPKTLADSTLNIKLSGVIENNRHLLEWTSISYNNNNVFEIEWSFDGKVFKKIASINTKKATKEMAKYEFRHHLLFVGTNYYRLKLVNLDHSFSYSNVIAMKHQTQTKQPIETLNELVDENIRFSRKTNLTPESIDFTDLIPNNYVSKTKNNDF
jgi:hypothetical protein